MNIRFYNRGQRIQTTYDSSEIPMTRFVLRQAWNTRYNKSINRAITPFRAATNSGDLLSRRDYSCGGSCQTPQSIPGIKGIRSRMGHIVNNCDGSGIPPASCNVKYVYDSSNYIKFRKQREVNVNYVDQIFGGSKFSIY